MDQDTDALTKRIEDAKSQIVVDSYQDVAFDGAFKSRSRGFWAVAAVGLAVGAAIGLAAPLIPAIVAVAGGAAITTALTEAAALIPASLAIFSAAGMGTGFAIGVGVGPASGAAASVGKEQERRMLEKHIEEKLTKDPNAIITDEDLGKHSDRKNTANRERLFNPKVGVLFAGIGAAGGLVMAASYIALGGLTGGVSAAVPAMSTLLGGAASSGPAVTAYFAGVMGSVGAIFGVNFPQVLKKVNAITGDHLSGEALNSSWVIEKAPVKQASQKIGEQTEEALTQRDERKQSFQDMVAKQDPDVSAGLRKF